MGRVSPLQDGRPTLSPGPAEAGRLVELKDVYLMVPIHPDHQCYLCFTVEQVDYQFTCLPFGLVCAPWAFTKIMKAVVTLLRS